MYLEVDIPKLEAEYKYENKHHEVYDLYKDNNYIHYDKTFKIGIKNNLTNLKNLSEKKFIFYHSCRYFYFW